MTDTNITMSMPAKRRRAPPTRPLTADFRELDSLTDSTKVACVICTEWRGTEYTVKYKGRARHLTTTPHADACRFVEARRQRPIPAAAEPISLSRVQRTSSQTNATGWTGGDAQSTGYEADWTDIHIMPPSGGGSTVADRIDFSGPVIGSFNFEAQMARSALREPGTASCIGDSFEDIWMNDEAGQAWEAELAGALAHTDRVDDEGDWTPFASKQVRGFHFSCHGMIAHAGHPLSGVYDDDLGQYAKAPHFGSSHESLLAFC